MTILKRLAQVRKNTIVEFIEDIHSDYVKNRFTYVEGKMMEEILRFLGATDADLVNLQQSGDDLGEDPTLPFRKSRNGRFLIDFDKKVVSRLSFQSFILSKGEEFIRYDSDILRNFRGIQDNVQTNSAFQALIKFQSIILQNVNIKGRPNLENNKNKWVSTIFQLRTITTPKLIGEPAKEGVHSDGVEHTMTTLIQSKNMTKTSAITQIHTVNQKTGIPWNDVNKEFVVSELQHRHFLDTVLIVDSELKHSVSEVRALNERENAIRDMIILFTRRPKAKTHSTYHFDSLDLHKEIPLTISL